MAEYSFEEEKEKFLLELKTASTSTRLLKKYSKKIRSNKELVLLLLLSSTERISEIAYISNKLSKDKDIFLLTINHDYDAFSFYYAHDDLKKDKEFILELFKIHTRVLNYICPELLNDEYFLWYINDIEDIRSDRHLISCISDRIRTELANNSKYLDDFAPPINCKPAKRN
jgi:hypothetical protein